jgi:hypothetical protein
MRECRKRKQFTNILLLNVCSFTCVRIVRVRIVATTCELNVALLSRLAQRLGVRSGAASILGNELSIFVHGELVMRNIMQDAVDRLCVRRIVEQRHPAHVAKTTRRGEQQMQEHVGVEHSDADHYHDDAQLQHLLTPELQLPDGLDDVVDGQVEHVAQHVQRDVQQHVAWKPLQVADVEAQLALTLEP